MPVSCYYVALAQVRSNSGRTPLRPNVATALWAVSRRIMQAQNVGRLTEPWLQSQRTLNCQGTTKILSVHGSFTLVPDA
jgi:hypothetical protein